MFNKGQLAGLMKQAQAMQDNLKKAQEELATIEVDGESGAGLVKVVMTCKHDVKRIDIDPSLLADDKDMLEDLVAAAFNAAVRKAEETSEQKMGKLTAGMPGLPPGMKLPVLTVAAPEWPIPVSLEAWIDGAAPPAGRGRQVGVAHGVSSAAARPRGHAAARARAAAGGHARAALRALQHLHRGGGLQRLPRPAPRRAPSCAWSRRRPTRPRWSARARSAAITSC